jgi:hypothetical protein
MVAVCLAFAPLARAQATRTWVSGVGDDVNPCSRTAPCKTFAGAISKTASNGEINALDPAGYGAVTITKSITLDGGTGSGWASILASGGVTGIIINGATIDVTLRNLSINGTGGNNGVPGSGIRGIAILNANRVFIENVQVFGFGAGVAVGIIDQRTNASAKKLYIKDTISRNNGTGIKIAPTGAPFTTAFFNNVAVVGNSGVGLDVNGALLNVTNSQISGNGTDGIVVVGGALGSFVMLDTVALNANGGAGLNLASGAANLTNCVIVANTSAGISGAGVGTFQNNKIHANGGGDNLPIGSTNLSVK